MIKIQATDSPLFLQTQRSEIKHIIDPSLFLQTHRSALSCNKNHPNRFCRSNFRPIEATDSSVFERARFGLNCYQNYYRLVFLFAYLLSAEQIEYSLHNLFLLFFPVMYVHGCNICCVFCVYNIRS